MMKPKEYKQLYKKKMRVRLKDEISEYCHKKRIPKMKFYRQLADYMGSRHIYSVRNALSGTIALSENIEIALCLYMGLNRSDLIRGVENEIRDDNSISGD